MGNFTLGRLGLDVNMDSANGPDRWDISGSRVRFSADIRATNLTDAKFARVQALGLVDNPDEPFVPFTWSEDIVFWDGFYRVLRADVSTVPASYSANWFPAEFELERLPDNSNAPLVESRLLGTCRTNSHGITNGVAVSWWATPGDAYQDRVAGTTTQNRTGSEGTVRVQYTNNCTATNLTDNSPSFFCAPADWYDCSARIQISGDGGSTFRAITGRQVLNLPTYWRLDNSLVRVTAQGGDGIIAVQHYATNGWATAKNYKLTIGGAGGSTVSAVGAFRALTILKNAPEEVRIRLTVEHSSSVEAAINVDLGLRRGALWVDGVLSRSSSALTAAESAATGYELGVWRNTAEAGTTHTSGVHATSDDGYGKYVLTGTRVSGTSTTTGGIYGFTGGSFANVFPFMIGYEPVNATTNDLFTNQVYGWFGDVHEVMRPVQR